MFFYKLSNFLNNKFESVPEVDTFIKEINLFITGKKKTPALEELHHDRP